MLSSYYQSRENGIAMMRFDLYISVTRRPLPWDALLETRRSHRDIVVNIPSNGERSCKIFHYSQIRHKKLV